jgi:hypothetical protein
MPKRGHRKPKRRNYKISKLNRRYDPNNAHHRLMLELHGEGWFEDAFNSVKNFVEDAASKIKNEFTNPDSLLNQAAKKIENELGKVFDPAKNGLKDKFEDFSRQVGPVFQQLGNKLANDLDPNKNGVKAAFDKFGADVNGAFNEIGNKIKEQAAKDKAALDSAFAGIGDALASSIGNKDWWEKTMTDPETYFFLAGALLQAAGSFLGPVGLAAANGVLGATRMIVKAAKGEQVNLSDVMDMVVSMVPGGGAAGKAAATGAKTATQVTAKAASSAKSLLDATIDKAKTMIPPPGQRAKKLGEQLVGMTQTAENMGIVPPLVAGTTPPTGSSDYKAMLQEAVKKRDDAKISAEALPAPDASTLSAETVGEFSMKVDDTIYAMTMFDDAVKIADQNNIGDGIVKRPNRDAGYEVISAYSDKITQMVGAAVMWDELMKKADEAGIGQGQLPRPGREEGAEAIEQYSKDLDDLLNIGQKWDELMVKADEAKISSTTLPRPDKGDIEAVKKFEVDLDAMISASERWDELIKLADDNNIGAGQVERPNKGVSNEELDKFEEALQQIIKKNEEAKEFNDKLDEISTKYKGDTGKVKQEVDLIEDKEAQAQKRSLALQRLDKLKEVQARYDEAGGADNINVFDGLSYLFEDWWFNQQTSELQVSTTAAMLKAAQQRRDAEKEIQPLLDELQLTKDDMRMWGENWDGNDGLLIKHFIEGALKYKKDILPGLQKYGLESPPVQEFWINGDNFYGKILEYRNRFEALKKQVEKYGPPPGWTDDFNYFELPNELSDPNYGKEPLNPQYDSAFVKKWFEDAESEMKKKSPVDDNDLARKIKTATDNALKRDDLPDHKAFYDTFEVFPEVFLNAETDEQDKYVKAAKGMPVTIDQAKEKAKIALQKEPWEKDFPEAKEDFKVNIPADEESKGDIAQQQETTAPPEIIPTMDPDLLPDPEKLEDLGIVASTTDKIPSDLPKGDDYNRGYFDGLEDADEKVQGRGAPRYKRRKLNRC